MIVIRRLIPLILISVLALGLLIPSHSVQAATFDLTVCDPDPLLNGAALINAITTANSNGQADTINLGSCTYSLNTVNNGANSGFGATGFNGLPVIANDGVLTINGNGATIIERISGTGIPNFRIFQISSGANLTLNNVTVRNGNQGGGTGFNVNGGGAFLNMGGTVTINNSTVSGNTSAAGGGGFLNNSGTVNIINSTFASNRANNQSGGGLYNASGATANITNSTFSANSANASGGAIYNTSGTITLTSSTLSGNFVDITSGGGIRSFGGTVNMYNTIIANSKIGAAEIGNCSYSNAASGDPVTINGSNNLLETDCSGSSGTNNLTNTIIADPALGALAANGGSTQTHALGGNSPALDAGDNTNAAALSNDQRGAGFTRVIGGRVDIGAYEAACGTTPFNIAAGEHNALIHAIGCANTDGVDSVINLTDSTYTLTIVNNNESGLGNNGLPGMADDGTLTINGNGAVIERGASAPNLRLIFIATASDVTLNSLTLRDGVATGSGGAIFSNGTLMLDGMEVSNNTTTGLGGGLNINGGTVTVKNSLFTGNSATYGGAIFAVSTANLTVINSTFTANSSPNGGAIANGGVAQITNSTVAGNTGSAALYNLNTLTLQNTLVADNPSGNCSGTITDNGRNIDSATSCGFGDNSLSSTDPQLGALADNGGLTRTMALGANSPALDAGDNTLAFDENGDPLLVDQRGTGFDRIIGSTIDIGAFEATCGTTPFNIGAGESGALIHAISCANVDGVDSVINLTSSTYALPGVNNMDGGLGGNGLPAVLEDGELTINGNGAIIERNAALAPFRFLYIEPFAILNFDSLTLRGGYNDVCGGGFYSDYASTVNITNSTITQNDTDCDGGGFYNVGTVNLTDSTVSNNSAGFGGGAFYNEPDSEVNLTNAIVTNNSADFAGGGFLNDLDGVVTITGSTFSNNTALLGGGFLNDGEVNLQNSTVSGNTAEDAAGFFNEGFTSILDSTVSNNIADFDGGGAINAGCLVIQNSTLSGNEADAGGGILNAGCASLTNSTLSDNTALIEGGGILNWFDLTLVNSTLTGNTAGAAGGLSNDGGDVLMNNSIIANSTGGECLNTSPGILDGSHNLVETICLDNGGTDNLTNTVIADPMLGAPETAANGTEIYPLGDFSPAIDAGDNSLALDDLANPLSTDQAGNPRFVNDLNVIDTGAGTAPIVDLGAVERQSNSPDPTISIDDVTLAEGDSATTDFVFTVTLSHASDQTITVDYATTDDTATTADNDYKGITTTTLTFNPGETSQQVTVVVTGDTQYEEDETFTVDLSNPSNATISDDQGLGTITNDDAQPTMSINDATRNEGNGGITYFTFTVTLSAPSAQTITVNYASADGTATLADNDYVERTGVLVFNPGVTQRQVSVVVNRDIVFEANESFTLNLSSPVNATIADGQGVGTITNDDVQPTIQIGDLTQSEGNSGTSNFTFTVTLSHASYQTITAQYATANGTATAGIDYTIGNGTVTFTPGVTSQPITVSVIGDITHETHETFTVNLSNPVNTTLADGQGAGLIANDDNRPVIRINDVSRTEGNSGTSNFPFVITLSNPSYQTITVDFATADGTATLANNDYISRNGVLSFTPGVTSRQITVQGNGDTVVEPSEIFNLYLSNPINAYLADNRGIGTLTNDDAAAVAVPLTLSAFAASVNEGESTTYTVALAAAPVDLLGSDSLSVQTSFDPAYLSVTPALLTFDATNWNIPQTVTVTAVDDTQALQPSISLPILHTLTAGDISLNGLPFGVTITDNDAQLVPVAPELPQIEAVSPVMPDAPNADVPGVVLVSPMHATSENPVAFTWIGTGDATAYRVLVQQQSDRAAVVDITVSAATCNGNICVLVSQFAPQMGVSYVWTVTPITASGAGLHSAEATFTYSASAPDGISLPGQIELPDGQ